VASVAHGATRGGLHFHDLLHQGVMISRAILPDNPTILSNIKMTQVVMCPSN
jgi:hypothetical protein